MYTEHRFFALGSEVEICLIMPDDRFTNKILSTVQHHIVDFERQFSRFDPQSELSHFNQLDHGDFYPSEPFMKLLIESKKYFSLTNGVFDPTVYDALNRYYAKSFDQVCDAKTSPPPVQHKYTLRDLKIDLERSTVTKPVGFHLDFGGIGKGYVVDQAADLIRQYTDNFWLAIGGDLIVSGTAENQSWQVGLAHPREPAKDIATMKPRQTPLAVATSGITKRKGRAGNVDWHHIINPKTGEPALTNALSATVMADSAAKADVLAKVAVILGIPKGLEFIDSVENAGCAMIDAKACRHDSHWIQEMIEYV